MQASLVLSFFLVFFLSNGIITRGNKAFLEGCISILLIEMLNKIVSICHISNSVTNSVMHSPSVGADSIQVPRLSCALALGI